MMKTSQVALGVMVFVSIAINSVAEVRYVDLNCASPVSPFLSWATAATSIQDAIDAAEAGDEIVVTNGIYVAGGRAVYGTMTNRVAVDKAVSVRSVNGPVFTHIQGSRAPGTVFGAGAIRCVYLTNGASLTGFTLTNGATHSSGNTVFELSGGGVWCNSTSAVVSGCVIAANHAKVQGGGAYGGTLNNCVFTGNSATNGGATFSNVLNNCTIVGNSSLLGVGGAHLATLNNCIVYFNVGQPWPNYEQCSLNYCCTLPEPSGGSGNLTDDPLFVDQPGGNFRLQSISPCINAGNSGPAPAGFDLDGNVRVFNGTVDIGAFEHQGVPTEVAPYILSQPTNNVVAVGSNALFTVGAGGTPPLSYQWRSNTIPVSRATNAFFTVTNAQLSHSGTLYSVTVTNLAGAITSSNAMLTVTSTPPTAPYITVHPTNQTVIVGGTATFTVWASGRTPLRYQWRSNAVSVAGATNAAYIITNVSLAYSGAVYSVTVSNVVDAVTSSNALLSVIPRLLLPPVITMQPTNQSAVVGSNVTLAVTATGTQPLTYQWNLNGSTPAWATNASATLTNVQPEQAGIYFVTITNVDGSVVSSNALLAVLVPITRYVNANSANPVSPYTTWESAARTIQEAIDVAVTGDEVVVGDGVYATGGRAAYGAMTNRVTVDKPLTVRSVNGALSTLIQGYQVPGTTNGDAAVRCVYLTNNATLVGFTLTGGATRTAGQQYREWCGGGLWCESVSSVISNCVLVGNSAYDDGGGAYGGTLFNCELRDNTASAGGGASGGWPSACTLYGCTVTGNRASEGGGVYGSSLYQCVFNDNSASVLGGGVSGSWLNDCVLVGNSATWAGGGAASSRLYGCTVTGNSALQGGGVYGMATNSILYNCIVYYNTAADGSNYWGSQFNYCCTVPAPLFGYANITNEPLFLDLVGGDLRLQPDSPCLNAGNNAYTTGLTDLAGYPRIVGGTVDMGAYEFQGSRPALRIVQSDGRVQLYWPAWASNFFLQEAGAAPETAGGWSNLNVQASVTNNANTVTLPQAGDTRFYRLSKP